MSLPVDELQKVLTPAEVKATLYRVQETYSLKTTAWLPGSVIKVLNTAVAYLGSGFSELVVALNQASFLDSAKGRWLDKRVVDTFGEEIGRIEALYARGDITIDNAGGGIYQFDPGELVIQNATTTATFANVNPFNVDTLQTGLVQSFRATTIGSASSSNPGDIDTLVTAALGLSVTNVDALVGVDRETDENYLVRARESSGRLSPNGPHDAYAYIAKSATRNGMILKYDPDGEVIDVNRVQVSASGNPVIVRVASSSGPVAGDKDTPSTDVYWIQQAIDRYAVPNGYEAEAYACPTKAIDVTATIYLRGDIGAEDSDIITAIETALTSFLTKTTSPIGGWVISPSTDGFVFRNMLIGVIERLELDNVDSANSYVVKADVALPAADVPIDVTEVPVPGTLAITVVRVG